MACPSGDKFKNTLGCDDHKGIAGLGQKAGKSAKSNSIIRLFCMAIFFHLDGDLKSMYGRFPKNGGTQLL
jgi:hypothetical protein